MKDPQEIFLTIQDNKKTIKEIRAQYKDALSHHEEYQKIVDEMTKLRETKKGFELAAQRDMGSQWNDLEELVSTNKRLGEMLTDSSLSKMQEGEAVDVRDEYDSRYEPVYTVTYKKVR